MRRLAIVLVSMLLALAVGISPTLALGEIAEYPVPTAQANPAGVVSGPGGNIWFTELVENRIGQVTPAGTITEFPVPTPMSGPDGITVGPDGNLWFTEFAAGKIGQMTPSGVFTEFPLPNSQSGPAGITVGPDGNLWFAELTGNKIGRITPLGAITEFPLPDSPIRFPQAITSGPDGMLWFTEGNPAGAAIGRISTAGAITEFALPLANSWPTSITSTSGPDASLWFTETSPSANQVGQISTSGLVINEYPLPTPASWPSSIVTGPDGNLYFGEAAPIANVIGQLSPTGVLAEFVEPTAQAFTDGLAIGPDANLWFSEGLANQIGTMSLSTPGAFVSRGALNTRTTTRTPSRSTGNAPAALAPHPTLAPTANQTTKRSSVRPAASGTTQVAPSAAPNTPIRTYLDGTGQVIELRYGQGTACTVSRPADFGWAHIVDKHMLGNWNCGGIVSTYPDTVGAATEEAVQALIYMALQQPPTEDPVTHRLTYRWLAPGTTYPIQVIVGRDAMGLTIITAYPLLVR